DPKQVKDAPDCAYPLTPPFKIIRVHSAPAIQRNAPVLSPFLGECILLESRLGRRAAAPAEHEFVGARENVGAIITYAEWNVAHERHTALLGMRFNVSPLLMRNPLHVTEEISASHEGCLFLLREIA